MIRAFLTAFTIVGSVIFAAAQPNPAFQQNYVPPDRELWEAMAKGFAELSMPLNAHQAIQNIMANVQQEARAREARAKAMKPIEAPKEDSK